MNITLTVPQEFVLCPAISPKAKMLWLVIRAFALERQNEMVCESVDTLSTAIGVKKDTFRKYSDELQDMGLLRVIQRKQIGRFMENGYIAVEFRQEAAQ